MRVRRALGVIAALLALGLSVAAAGWGAAPPPPCPAGVVAVPTFVSSDQDESGSSRLVATHTISVFPDFGETTVDDGSVRWVVPATANVIGSQRLVDSLLNFGPGGLVFVSDVAGATPLTATWTQDDGSGGQCMGSASTTLQLEPATRMPRLKNERALEHLHPNLKYDLLWRYATNLGPTTDLDPVIVMARGISQPRLPGAKVPFKTVTVPLRLGDPGFSHVKQQHILLPHWSITTSGDESAFDLGGDERFPPNYVVVPLGYEVKVLQSGQLIARLRLAGHCSNLMCHMRTIKVWMR